MKSICNGWEFTPCWSEEFGAFEGEYTQVRLPHTVKELPLHYAGTADYEMVSGYRRTLSGEDFRPGKRYFLRFDGAAHGATVYFNGVECARHNCGYTAFSVEITRLIRFGEENRLAVRLDSRESLDVPPFGFVIDYLTYGGLYREVWLDERNESFLEDVFVSTPRLHTLCADITVNGDLSRTRLSLLDGDRVIYSTEGEKEYLIDSLPVESWSVDSPKLYTCRVSLLDKKGECVDSVDTTVGFRTAEFKKDGFYLNGEKLFLRGLNRHQSYPYVGYAAPEHLQREDARILKHELQCNLVRTSHYPQSQHFIDQCDREGLLVFTEIPGWQHIGGESWKKQAEVNTREMVLQYRNHPSIILWGVRINESMDDDALYMRTNAIAHALDPGRQTGGVRFIEKSALFEDVYTYNDFSHTGDNPGVKKKVEVTPDMEKALLITEHSGHMFPTKSFDCASHRESHALRHARVLSDAAADGEHAGCIGWCMFDYATHRDFGAGDRICYHGVTDSFRNAKLAAAVYASQGEEQPVLEISSTMDGGEYPGGTMGELYAFTNGDSVRLYKNGVFVSEFSSQGWDGLKHGPIHIDDFVGQLLKTQEGFSDGKAAAVRRCLVGARKYGVSAMPLRLKMEFAACMLRYKMSYADGVALYGKYVGGWGTGSMDWRFEAVKDGKVIASIDRHPSTELRMEARASQTCLHEGSTYDMAAVRMRILDGSGCVATFAQLPVKLSVTGALELVGPDVVTAEGGMCGTYLRTLGVPGEAVLTIETPQTEAVELHFTVE